MSEPTTTNCLSPITNCSRLGLKELLEVKTSEQKALQKRIVDLFRDKAWKKQGLNQGLLTEQISKAYVISFSGTEQGMSAL